MTPLRAALKPTSPLRALVKEGLGAMDRNHRKYIDQPLRPEFADSLAFDEAMLTEHPQANRWDYFLGHGESRVVIGVEPHSAKQDEISALIAKQRAARDQIREHMRDDARISAWFWVASKRVYPDVA